MRPKSIVYFERIIFGVLLLDILQTYVDWDQMIAEVAMSHPNSAVALILAATVFTLVLIGTLTLLVSRRHSKIAMWASIALFALLLASFVSDIAVGLLGSDIVFGTVHIGQAVAYSLLFTPSARRWMSREDEKLVEVFH